MESIMGNQASFSAGAAAGVLKDTTGAQIISKTLANVNVGAGGPGSAADPNHQFQKDVLAAAGIGNKLDAIA